MEAVDRARLLPTYASLPHPFSFHPAGEDE